MDLAFDHSMQRPPRAPLGRRAVALLVVLLVHALLVLVLIMLAPPERPPPEALVFEARAVPDAAKTPAPKPAKRAVARPAAKRAVAPAPKVVLPPSPDSKPFDTHLFEAVDIAKLPNVREQQADAGAVGAGDSALAEGSGPGGAKLYQAEWQREPTHAELAYYLPRGAPDGAWAVIACRTVARYRVEDCVELGESPPGSGLARSVNNAAWQFRVRPPRIGGEAMVGEWVKIRIDFGAAEG